MTYTLQNPLTPLSGPYIASEALMKKPPQIGAASFVWLLGSGDQVENQTPKCEKSEHGIYRVHHQLIAALPAGVISRVTSPTPRTLRQICF